MSFFKKLITKLPILLFDVSVIPLAWLGALFLQNNLRWNNSFFFKPSLFTLLVLMAIQVGSFYYCKIYRGVWQFFSFSDVTRIVKSVLLGIIGATLIRYSMGLSSYSSLATLIIYAMILLSLLCAGRSIFRYFLTQEWRETNPENVIKRVLIIGAGSAGEGLIRELQRTQVYLPIGLVDDNPRKKGSELHGIPVLGTVAQLPLLVEQWFVDIILIAIPSASSLDMRRIVMFAERCQVPVRTLPGVHAVASGQVAVQLLRQVNIEDLLGRDQVQLDWDKIKQYMAGKRVLITGGGGSIGSELCHQILRLKPKSVLVLDISEYNLYKIEREMREKFPDIDFKKALMCVNDVIGVNQIFDLFKPQAVFHAAAYKHVPMLQDQTRIAVKNNVLGTQCVAEASIAVGVEKFILISTDKAVNPTNVMGASKRAAEIYCENIDASVATQFIIVRFGNVLGSVGSVVPLFQQQLDQGGPITVTHPDVQRYFMTIREACELILQATVNGLGGEIFVLDMGEPVKITYLAEQMIHLAGKKVGKDIQIQYTGLRAGEKLFEELFHPAAQLTVTEHEKLLKAKNQSFAWSELMEIFQLLKTTCDDPTPQEEALVVLLKNLVPEWVHASVEYSTYA